MEAKMQYGGDDFSPPKSQPPGTVYTIQQVSSPTTTFQGYDGSESIAKSEATRPMNRQRLALFLTDIVSVILCLAPLIFVCVVAALDRTDLDDRYDGFQTALTTLGPLFPMVFAFITSRLLFQIARQRLERGSTLETLEQLMGSRTLGSTLETHAELQIVNLAAVGLFIMWAFSPLGGQALLRVLYKTTTPMETKMRYWDTTEASSLSSFSLFTKSTYYTSLYAHDDIRLGPDDPWGNVKIPFLDVDATPDDQGWRGLPADSAVKYSALVGIPTGNTTVGNSTFNIESTYIDLVCEAFKKEAVASGTTQNISRSEVPLTTLTAGSKSLVNGTWYGSQHNTSATDSFWNLALNRFVGSSWQGMMTNVYTMNALSRFINETDIEAGPTKLLFQARRNQTGSQTLKGESHQSECQVLQKYVESQVECSRPTLSRRPSCQVVRQRPSRHNLMPENLSVLSTPNIFTRVTSDLPSLLIESYDQILPYLYNQSVSAKDSLVTPTPDFTLANLNNFSKALSQVLNSYLLVVQANLDIYKDLNVAAWELEDKDPNTKMRLTIWKPSPGETTAVRYVYRINWGWMSACIIACVILALNGVAGIYFAHSAVGPEVLGLVSSSLRDSRFLDIPRDIRHLDGYHFSQLMKLKRFRYGHTSQSTPDRPVLGIALQEDVRKLH